MFELRLIQRLAQAIEAPRIRIPEFGGGAGSIPEPYTPPVNTATGEPMSEDDAGLTMQIEARVPEGYGARWALTADGARFRGFLEPPMEDGHAKRWRH